MVPEEVCLRRNTAAWDRAWRCAVALAIPLKLRSVVRNPYALIGGGILSGFLLVAGITGY